MIHTKYQGPRPSGFKGDIVYSKLLTWHDGRRTTDDAHWAMAIAHPEPMDQVG